MSLATGEGGMRILFLLLIFVVPGYFVWDGAVSRKLDFYNETIQASAEMLPLGDVYLSHLENVGESDAKVSKFGWGTKVIVVRLANKGGYIIRSMRIRASFKSKADGGALTIDEPCLRYGKVEFRLLAGQEDPQLCIVWLPKLVEELVRSPEFDGWSWSGDIFGHNQPVAWVVPLLQLWDGVARWGRRVNQ